MQTPEYQKYKEEIGKLLTGADETPVFMPKPTLKPIAEEDIFDEPRREIVEDGNRHKSVEPMIKQFKNKRNMVTAKSELKIRQA